MAIIGFKKVDARADEYFWESRDCVLRASTIATGKSYAEMHAAFKAAGRKDRKGTYSFLIDSVLGTPVHSCGSLIAPTLAQFIRKHRKGRWVMCNRNHAWAVIDGVVHDAVKIGARTRVLQAWKISN